LPPFLLVYDRLQVAARPHYVALLPRSHTLTGSPERISVLSTMRAASLFLREYCALADRKTASDKGCS